MNAFSALFGIREKEIKKNCILMPLLRQEALDVFGVKKLNKGRLYNCAQSADFTLIHTRIGPGFTGDAVLYLKETPCKNIFLFGSCGLVKSSLGMSIGSLFSPDKCYSQESFSELLFFPRKTPKAFFPDKELLSSFLKFADNNGIKKTACSTLASLKLEEKMISLFQKRNIPIIEMECSAFFSAASYSRLKAIALFYASDIIHEKPFYFELSRPEKAGLSNSVKSASGILCDFISKNSRA